jgi:O-phospho-L-seryl-tRNASec:L-selenocysteinyl-tRNA synthase
MNEQNFALAKSLVSSRYIDQARQARACRERMLASILSQRRMPDDGWDDKTIELFLQELSAMDSNNFVGHSPPLHRLLTKRPHEPNTPADNIGVGEREARVFSKIVRSRHFGFAHGIGRSGDVAAEQPKAAGASLIVRLAEHLALDALHVAGARKNKPKVAP